MSNVRIFALGGLDENGKNLYCLEIDDRIFVINCGAKLPEEEQYGVESIVPDFSYLVENKERVKAVIITHIHDDMMDAVPFLLKEINVPVYAPMLCCFLLKDMIEAAGIKNYQLLQLPRQGETVIDGVNVKSFGLCHSSFDAIGVAVETDLGYIVVAEQYVIDLDNQDSHFSCDIGTIAEIGSKGVFAALVEASGANTEGFTSPRHRITNSIRPVFEDATGRIIVSCYKQNFYRIREIISLASEFRKVVYFYDDKLAKFIRLVSDLNYYSLPKGVVLSRDKFTNDIDDIVIIVSESGKKLFNKMNRIATDEDDLIELKESDTIIIASPVTSGLENEASAMENELYKDNVNIYKLDSKKILSVHPSMEDIKLMLSLLKPKYFIPVMGDYRQFINSANLAMSCGFTPDRIIILDNGQVATFRDGKLVNCSEFVKFGETHISSIDKKDVKSSVLKDREILSTDGVIIVGLAVSYKTKEIIGGPDIQSRGVIYVKDSEYVIRNIGKMVTDIIEEMVNAGIYENMAARAQVREKIAHYVLRETGKRPMILPAIIEINI